MSDDRYTTGHLYPSRRKAAQRRLRAEAGLPRGAIRALNAARWRVPDDAPEHIKALADLALEQMAGVLDGSVPPDQAHNVLLAARMIREEVCGAPTKSLKVEGKMGLETLLGELDQDKKLAHAENVLQGALEDRARRAQLPAGDEIEAEVVANVDPEPGDAS